MTDGVTYGLTVFTIGVLLVASFPDDFNKLFGATVAAFGSVFLAIWYFGGNSHD